MLLTCPQCVTISRVDRPRGALRNVGSWSGHAAPLQVRVTRTDGMILNETVIRLDDRIIAANQQSLFFVQLDIDSSAKAEVSVTPISRPIFDQGSVFCRCGKIGN